MTNQAFSQHGVVPDIIPEPPQKILSVQYEKSGQTVNLGKELTPLQVREEPTVTIEGNSGDFYTLIMTDPDVPSRENPIRAEIRHWLIVNIPGSDLTKGQLLTEYHGSLPPEGSGLHRYIFLLYKQKQLMEFNEKFEGRAYFSARKFAEKYELKLEAGNFYQAAYDESVPESRRRLGVK